MQRNVVQSNRVVANRVVLADGKECFYPFKVYCFNSAINQVESLLKRPNFAQKCEQWRVRVVFTVMFMMEKYGKTL